MPAKVGCNTEKAEVLLPLPGMEPIPCYCYWRAYSLCAWPAVNSGGPVTVTGNEPLLPLPKQNYAQP